MWNSHRAIVLNDLFCLKFLFSRRNRVENGSPELLNIRKTIGIMPILIKIWFYLLAGVLFFQFYYYFCTKFDVFQPLNSVGHTKGRTV